VSVIGGEPEQKRPCQEFIHSDFVIIGLLQVKSYLSGLKHVKKLHDFPYHSPMQFISSQPNPDTLVSQYSDGDLILLESQDISHPSSQKSYLACRPSAVIYGTDNRITVIKEGKTVHKEMNPWEAIRSFRRESPGWLFGYLGYDLKNHSEKLVSSNPALIETPDFYLMQPEVIMVLENGRWEMIRGVADDLLSASVPLPKEQKPGVYDEIKPVPLISREQYLDSVSQIKNDIAEGEYYELNYSYPIESSFSGSPYQLYKKMREINPVPFGSFIRTGDFSICCASPERFLKKTGNRILSEPIKGTSGRSENEEEDIELKSRLLNEKNKAENLMIVDLVRHDMSLVANPGSVRVTKLFDIQTFGTVHQLISSVEAEVQPEADPVEIIRACFPMGSMTGAPKIRVMKAIEQYEIYRRGIYSGAIGYIDPDGNFDFNVVIRSAIISGNKLLYPVGGAITSDSDAEDEWQETVIKSRVLSQSSGISAGVKK
jgi:para-aminobenzoate synthetase component I